MDSSQLQVENLKLTRIQKLQIANRNEKRDTILSQINAPKNSRQEIATVNSVCVGDFWIVFEPAHLFRFIDKSCWAGSKTSKKSPSQTAFTVILRVVSSL